jgi:hypothetical protein
MYYATTFNQEGQEDQTPNSTYRKGGFRAPHQSAAAYGKNPAKRQSANR